MYSKLSGLKSIKNYKSNIKLYNFLFKKFYPLEKVPKYSDIFDKKSSNYDINYSLCMSKK